MSTEDSGFAGLQPKRTGSVSEYDLAKLEKKIDRITQALDNLIRLEERFALQGTRIGDLEKEVVANKANISAIEKKVEQWINRGIGVWAFASFIWILLQFLSRTKFLAGFQ